MSAAVDRMWSIRDAILAWLYEEKANLRAPQTITAEQIRNAVGWTAEPITDDELVRDGTYLEEEEYIRGIGNFGSLLPVHPELTARGENFAAKGVSVRPGPERQAITTGVTNTTYNFHAPSQVAINSSDFEQTLTIEGQKDQVNAVADALDEYAAQDLPNAAQARGLAGDLRDAAMAPEQNAGRLRTLLATVVGIATTSAGTAIGQQLTEAAVALLQALPS